MGIVVTAKTISHHHPNNEVIVGELLPRDIHWSTHWSVDWSSALSERLLRKIQQNNFHESRPDWTLPDNSLNMQLYHKDHLHHIESRNVKFPKSITETLHDVADHNHHWSIRHLHLPYPGQIFLQLNCFPNDFHLYQSQQHPQPEVSKCFCFFPSPQVSSSPLKTNFDMSSTEPAKLITSPVHQLYVFFIWNFAFISVKISTTV